MWVGVALLELFKHLELRPEALVHRCVLLESPEMWGA